MSTVLENALAKPADIAAAFAESWNRHDMKAFARLFTEDAQMVNVVGMWWHSRAEIQEVHETLHAGPFRDSRLIPAAPSVQALNDGAVAVHVPWRLIGQYRPDGTPDGEREGILLLVAVKRDGGWRIQVAQNTDIMPGIAVPAGLH